MPTFISKYKIIEKIGEGSFSEVLKCENRVTRQTYAAKILKKSFQSNSDVYYCAEVIAMQKLSKHPNVLYMLEYFFEKKSKKVVFIFELMDMSMYDFMKSKKRCIPEARVKTYLYQMLNGLDYLHRNGLFHRDIKPENILVKLNPPIAYMHCQSEQVKIADLGSIRGIYSKPPYTEYISTRWYRSPECLLTSGHYGPKMDIWATGCVFYEILTTKPLFSGTNEIDQLTRIHSVLGTPSTRLLSKLKSRSANLKNFQRQIGTGLTPHINQFSDDGQTVLKLMLQYDPEIRSNARRLLQHRYFNDLKQQERYAKLVTAHIGQEYGDQPNMNFNLEYFKKKRFQSNSMKTLLCKSGESLNKQNLSAKTAVDLMGDKKSKGSFDAKKNLKMYNSNSDTQRRKKSLQAKTNLFRKTTSNLTKKTEVSDDHLNMKAFQSTSFVMPKRICNRETRRPKF